MSTALTTGGHGVKDAMKYYLPKLLLMPIIHVFTYFKYIKMFLSLVEQAEARECLKEAEDFLSPLQRQLDRTINNSPHASYIKKKRK